MFGRIGCFLPVDDCGWPRPSNLPSAVSLPRADADERARSSDTALRKTGLRLIAMLLIRWRRRRVRDAEAVGRYLLVVGILRFFVEFVRVHEPLMLGLTPALWISLGAALAGLLLQMKSERRPFALPPSRRV